MKHIHEFYETEHYSYFITSAGDVYRYNKRRGTILPMKCSTADGHYKLIVLENGKKFWYAHRLVYEAFVGEIPEGLVVDHIDNDFTNNRVWNLQVITKSENTQKYYDWQRSLEEA